MYHPYFRGKQYELITIRETAGILKENGFVPVIEPVKQSLGALNKTLSAIKDEGGDAVVVVNPFHGDHADNGDSISQFLMVERGDYEGIRAGILLKEETSLAEAIECCNEHAEHPIALIHAGFSHGKDLAGALGEQIASMKSLFIDGRSSKLYQRHFATGQRVLLRDGFKSRRNRDYPPVEFFSDLHVTYEDEGMGGFGDFLIVGDEYRETGGPAYAVAIHITFIDDANDGVMNIYHFVSDRQDTPTDPAGKFGEALAKLMAVLEAENNKIFESDAIKEFRELSARGHYPGLGYVKKLSMKHHIETLANYFAQAE